MSKNRYKFTFGQKTLTLTTDKDNLYMEEVERLAKEKYQALKSRLLKADDETLALLLAINCLSVQLGREKAFDQLEEELASLKGQSLPAVGTSEDLVIDQTSLFEEEDL